MQITDRNGGGRIRQHDTVIFESKISHAETIKLNYFDYANSEQ